MKRGRKKLELVRKILFIIIITFFVLIIVLNIVGVIIYEAYQKQESYNGEIFNRAINEKNLSLCKLLPEWKSVGMMDASISPRNKCIMNIEAKIGNLNFCKNITYFRDKDDCYHILIGDSKNISLCMYGNGEQDYDCYLTSALYTQNISVCGLIRDSINASKCYYSLVIEPFIQNTSISICDNVLKDDRDRCYAYIAEKDINFSICDLINDPSILNACYSDINRYSYQTNISICKKMFDYNVKKNKSYMDTDFCYEIIADRSSNVSICSYIENLSRRDSCISDNNVSEYHINKLHSS